MRVIISADMEGATGVTCPRDVEPGTPQWARFRQQFTADANAVALGLLDAGIDDVVINEAHATMRNILLEELDERVRLITGRHKPLGMMQGVPEADAVVFLGYHAGAGQRGVLSHTYLGNAILGVWLDGIPASEGYLNAALAQEHGVPVIMVTGDDKTCDDAMSYAPDAEHVAVKEYVSRYSAICLPPQRTFRLQREAAARAAAQVGRFAPATAPHRIEVEFDAVQLADATALIPTIEQVGERRIAFEASTMTDAMRTFKIVSSIAGAAREEIYD
jgi:D-amino peptidase